MPTLKIARRLARWFNTNSEGPAVSCWLSRTESVHQRSAKRRISCGRAFRHWHASRSLSHERAMISKELMGRAPELIPSVRAQTR